VTGYYCIDDHWLNFPLFPRHHVAGGQRDVLADQLKSCQEQVQTLQAELAIYQSLLEAARKDSAEVGAQASPGGSGAQGSGTKGGLLDERTLRVLEEVAGLREQLDSSIRNNNTLAEELRDRLDRSEGAHSDHTDGHETHANKATGTGGASTKEKGSGSGHAHQRSVQTQYTVRANVTASGFQTKPRGMCERARASDFSSTNRTP
jgi:hypothetical protein